MGPPLEPEIPKISPERFQKDGGFTPAAARLNAAVSRAVFGPAVGVGRTSNANGRTKYSARHRSIQPSSSGRKASVFLKSLWRNLGNFRLQRGPHYNRRPHARAGRLTRCYASLSNRPAMPKNTAAAPTHSN